jgi:type I restriction enzyme, R subunit
MRQTQMAVVVSEEQGEVEKFRKWELDITPHRRLIKEGIDLPEAMRKQPQFQNMQRLALDDAFKAEEHPFRVAIVCAMWLTGFDVPSLSTLYLDKPLKAHTLMQAIARANRVNEGKNNGMIVDYCGILKNLRKALATFAGTGDDGRGGKAARPNRPSRMRNCWPIFVKRLPLSGPFWRSEAHRWMGSSGRPDLPECGDSRSQGGGQRKRRDAQAL